MAVHMSVRLAWHSDGWNGHICKKPCENVYCVGQHSYPGELIAETRDLEFEKAHAGEPCSAFPCKTACGLSVNAFGKESIQVKVNPPSWWKKGEADSTVLTLPPYTACTWCYEAMYKDEVSSSVSGKTYDNDKRQKNAEAYFAQFEEGKSLVFYYAGYSNPFSEEEEDTYVIVGLSRIRKIDDFHYYENTTEKIRADYAGGVIWQKPITSNYPNEGFSIPYAKYMEKEEVLNRIAVKPQHRSPFKYGSREVSNDDAIEIMNQLLNTVDVLIEIGDDTENWDERKKWINSVLNELWKARGPYPGFASAMVNMGLEELVQYYISITDEQDMKRFREEVKELLEGERDDVSGHIISDLRKVRREYMLKEEEEQQLLMDILPRFDLSAKQMKAILSEKRSDVSITASLAEMVENPYIIFEQYIGMDSDDTIPFYKIDNGMIASPEYGIADIFDAGATERLRAFCVDELNRIAAHSFGKAETILKSINHRLDRMPDWKRYTYKLKNFKIDRDILDKALEIKEDDDKTLYLYLKWVYEDERQIENVFTMLAERPDISLKMAITKEKFKKKLRNPESRLNETASEQYEAILDKQADICMQIFSKPICVLAGAAGTGKTTVIKAIVENIERVHGQAAGFLLMAPTGKAAERIKTQTEKNSMTIHSYLAGNGWLNRNFTLKRVGGSKGQDVNTIIIDECSMIDLNLFAALVRSINWNSVQRLILVGDPNQLPPIGRGKNLELAYAISVHKSQGSEFDYVYIIIPKRDSHLLSMELLYTAVTRAQKKVTVLLQEDMGTLTSLGHIEKSAVRRINSSVFRFEPLPEELLYIQNWYADEKKLATLSEYFVRSKSEVIIANMLVEEDVPFVYEDPLYAPDGTMFLPDFTVQFRGETYYWEHVGRLDLPDYSAHWERKKKWYEQHFPGKLLITYEGKDLSTDAMAIIKEHK